MDSLIVGSERPIVEKPEATPPFLVVDNFLPADLAWAMRRDIESHFAEPYRQDPDIHQIWNYWFVPGLYSYLRTMPEKIFQENRTQRFFETLKTWSKEMLGLVTISHPYLSLYLPGCRQGLHNDSANGRMAFVYSLTSDTRLTQGGQTLIFNDNDPFRANLRKPAAGSSFYSAVEPSFNRLILFDDRMPHGVEQMVGSMDPLDGRFVMHGHISESAPIVEGALAPEQAFSIVGDIVNQVFSAEPDFMSRYHGPLCLRIDVEESGAVEGVHILLHRVVPVQSGDTSFPPLLAALIEGIRTASFPKAPAKTKIILPTMFGGVLPFLAAEGAAR